MGIWGTIRWCRLYGAWEMKRGWYHFLAGKPGQRISTGIGSKAPKMGALGRGESPRVEMWKESLENPLLGAGKSLATIALKWKWTSRNLIQLNNFEVGFILGLLDRGKEKCKIEIFELWNWTWEMNHETTGVEVSRIEDRGAVFWEMLQ